MICTKCNIIAIENHAYGNKFWYCKQCKTEVFETIEIGPSQLTYEEAVLQSHLDMLGCLDWLGNDPRK